MKRILLGAVLLSAVFVSCKKDKDKVCDLNAANLVGSYKTTAISYKSDVNAIPVDAYAAMPNCEKDDLTIFNSNNTVTYTDAGAICTPPLNDTGAWVLSGSNIIVDGQQGTISNFTCSGMTITLAGTTVGETFTVTLVKQ